MRFSLIKREPSYFFENMHEDLSRFLKDTFGDMAITETNSPMEGMFRPAVEIKEKKDEYKINVQLPGVKKDDIDVELTENGLLLKAESKWEKTNDEENVHTSEFRYGKFVRTIPLEQPINPEEATSEYKDGVLHITLKKKEPDQKEEIKKLKIE